MDKEWERVSEEIAKQDPRVVKNESLSPKKKKMVEKYAEEISKIKDVNKALDYTRRFARKHNLVTDDLRGYIPARIAYISEPDIFDMIGY